MKVTEHALGPQAENVHLLSQVRRIEGDLIFEQLAEAETLGNISITPDAAAFVGLYVTGKVVVRNNAALLDVDAFLAKLVETSTPLDMYNNPALFCVTLEDPCYAVRTSSDISFGFNSVC